MTTIQFKALQLNSPVGSEPMIYTWPLQVGTGADKHDSGLEIIDTIKWVCEDVSEIRTTIDLLKVNDIDTTHYKVMSDLCEKYNKAVDSVVSLVRLLIKNNMLML